MFWKAEPAFSMFSADHLAVILIIVLLVIGLKFYARIKTVSKLYLTSMEKAYAISLLSVEWLYYFWMIQFGKWNVSHSLPLELCSISLYAAILLLWTNNHRFYPFVLFAGIGGAIQAIVTPDLEAGFPNFRFFHFFYTHSGIILIALYFTWHKGFRPAFKDLLRTMIILNIIAAIVYVINKIVNGNYMFLRMKPEMGSLLDYLGDYPWYLLSLEAVAFMTFLFIWLVFKRKKPKKIQS